MKFEENNFITKVTLGRGGSAPVLAPRRGN